MRFNQMPKMGTRSVSTRRLKAAERFLQKEQDKFPLLSSWVAEQQPTAIERIETFDKEAIEHWNKIRNHEAAVWRKARQKFYSYPVSTRIKINTIWKSMHPGSACYFLDVISKFEKEGHEALNIYTICCLEFYK